jgi:hypothetical protein
LLLPEVRERRDKLVVGVFQKLIELVVDLREEDGKLFDRVRDDDLVVGQRGPDAVELEGGQAVGQGPLGLRQLPGSVKNILKEINRVIYD